MLGSWIGLLIGVPLISFLASKLRKIIGRNAAFYGRMNILVVGGVYGVALSVIVHFLTWTDSGWHIPFAILIVWGFLATQYIRFRENVMDEYNKAGQTAFVATIAYVLCSITLIFAF